MTRMKFVCLMQKEFMVAINEFGSPSCHERTIRDAVRNINEQDTAPAVSRLCHQCGSSPRSGW